MMGKCNGEEYKTGERVIHKYRGAGVVSVLEEKNPDPTSVFVDLDIDPEDPTDEGETVEVSIGLIEREYA